MMLLTFSYNFDIPERIHLFYEQAFDALYQRHDSHKPGGFTRQFKTNLSEDKFKRVVSYFCLITYNSEKFTFTKNEAANYLEKALKLIGSEESPFELLADLNLCVCFLIEDGLQYIFSHRSFQEYFCAHCLAFSVPDRMVAFLEKISKRTNDQVIPLLADMSPEIFRKQYIVPMTNKYINETQIRRRYKSVPYFIECSELIFAFKIRRDAFRKGNIRNAERHLLEFVYVGETKNEFYSFASIIRKISNPDKVVRSISDPDMLFDEKSLVELCQALNAYNNSFILVSARNSKLVFCVDRSTPKDNRSSAFSFHDDPHLLFKKLQESSVSGPELDKVFQKSPLYLSLLNTIKSNVSYLLQARNLEERTISAMDALFQSNVP